MTNNLLLSSSADDLAHALFDATPGAQPDWRAMIVRRLAQELRTNAAHAVPVLSLPAFAPAWATQGAVSHLLPDACVRDELATLVRALAAAAAPPRGLKRRNSTLAQRCEELARAFEHERWPLLVDRAACLLAALETWSVEERRRRRDGSRLRAPETAPGAAGRSWRRVCSVADLLEAGQGARWCLLKQDGVARRYLDRFRSGDLSFWTLHGNTGEVLALLSHADDGEVDEFRTLLNEVATPYRADVLRLVRAGHATLDWPSADVEALAFDPDLGRRGQPFHEGVLQGRKCSEPIRYRLWSDGRRRRYLFATGTSKTHVPKTWARLDASPKTATAAMLTGAEEAAWTASRSALLRAILIDAFPNDGRPKHVRRGIRVLRKL